MVVQRNHDKGVCLHPPLLGRENRVGVRGIEGKGYISPLFAFCVIFPFSSVTWADIQSDSVLSWKIFLKLYAIISLDICTINMSHNTGCPKSVSKPKKLHMGVIKVVLWNVCGCNHPKKIINYVKQTGSDIAMIQETHLSKEESEKI